MKHIGAVGCAIMVLGTGAAAHGQDQFPLGQITKGAGIYSQNCAPCHGARMLDANSAFDLRTFPPNEKSRFVLAVSKGKNAMPPWGDLFKSDDIDALWAYVVAGEKK